MKIQDSITKPAPFNTYTISARGKREQEPIFGFLRRNFPYISLGQIESVFGFVEKSTLYGGRTFEFRQLSDRDVFELNSAGIGLRIPMTNHIASREEYEINKPLLRKYHNSMNSMICTDDQLARWIRNDFPYYEIEASVIKNINRLNKLGDAFDIYNTLVLPMASNDDTKFLNAIEQKSRIRLFANGGCAYTCPSKICYRSISEKNKNKETNVLCSSTMKERDAMGMVDFDIKKLSQLGFHKFKLLRSHPFNMSGY